MSWRITAPTHAHDAYFRAGITRVPVFDALWSSNAAAARPASTRARHDHRHAGSIRAK